MIAATTASTSAALSRLAASKAWKPASKPASRVLRVIGTEVGVRRTGRRSGWTQPPHGYEAYCSSTICLISQDGRHDAHDRRQQSLQVVERCGNLLGIRRNVVHARIASGHIPSRRAGERKRHRNKIRPMTLRKRGQLVNIMCSAEIFCCGDQQGFEDLLSCLLDVKCGRTEHGFIVGGQSPCHTEILGGKSEPTQRLAPLDQLGRLTFAHT